MQNQALPKQAIGEAYYARQLLLYFLSIVVHLSGKQDKNGAISFTCGEHQQPGGVNSVASSVTHFLNEKIISPNCKVEAIRLFSDSCGGQNKNFTVLLAISMFAAKHSMQ